jgi:hypothetical protein
MTQRSDVPILPRIGIIPADINTDRSQIVVPSLASSRGQASRASEGMTHGKRFAPRDGGYSALAMRAQSSMAAS